MGKILMNNNEYLAIIILEQLDRGLPIVIASIVSLLGSSPRHNGTKMLIGENGKSYGTIGGSLLEATSIKEGKIVLEQKRSKFMHFDLTGNGVYSKGMICGGKAVILLDYVSPTKENIEFFKMWYGVISGGQDSYLLTYIKSYEEAIDVIGRAVLLVDGKVLGSSLLSPADIDYIRTEIHNISMTSILNIRDIQVVVDLVRKLKTLYCFGAGHVAMPTARIAAMTGFRVIVID